MNLLIFWKLSKCSVISQTIHLKNSVTGFDIELITQLYVLLTSDHVSVTCSGKFEIFMSKKKAPGQLARLDSVSVCMYV